MALWNKDKQVTIDFVVNSEEARKLLDECKEVTLALGEAAERADAAAKRAEAATKEMKKVLDRAGAEKRKPIITNIPRPR